jgi:lipopolysaccharide transport system ATP-binding protein
MAKIVAKDIIVDIPIYEASSRSLKTIVLKAATGGALSVDSSQHVSVRALNRLAFEISEGDRVGLLGHNGSGKTTLLRVMAGAYEPVSGSIDVQGKVASMLNIWLGMMMDATGYENIFLRARMLGLKPAEITPLVDEICDFAELGDYIHMPMRTYSSGMLMRLGFAISTSISADIILMDEWMSAGDASFAERARDRLNRMLGRAKILVLASHDEELIRATCNKVMKLDHGKMIEFSKL